MAVHVERNPFPSVCGRVCHHPCEAMCKRAELDDGVSVAAIKRFMADEVPTSRVVGPAPVTQTQRVAVVGAGPAGLSCAYQLALAGFPVTVFESLPRPGGMLEVGLPAFRMPKDVVAREVQTIADLGVEIRTGQRLGRDFTLDSLLREGYAAVFVAVGTHVSSALGIENEDAPGVLPGMDFLRELNLGTPQPVGARVVVVGGGSVAMDAARSSLRLQEMAGTKRDVTLVYRRSRTEMPAFDWEVAEGDEEGLHFVYLTAPARVLTDDAGHVAGLECIRMELGDPDDSGRRRPIPVLGSEFVLECDTVIPAIGLSLDPAGVAGRLQLSDGGTIVADRFTFQTSDARVFAGGDAVRGPSTLVEAIGDGQRAAFEIERSLTGSSLREELLDQMKRLRKVPRAVPADEVEAEAPRVQARRLPADQRVRGFAEVVGSMTADEAVCEARRCLRCDLES
jgi:NADPH-dependent glutamate synthase beta subunit-like oxidoreductase